MPLSPSEYEQLKKSKIEAYNPEHVLEAERMIDEQVKSGHLEFVLYRVSLTTKEIKEIKEKYRAAGWRAVIVRQNNKGTYVELLPPYKRNIFVRILDFINSSNGCWDT